MLALPPYRGSREHRHAHADLGRLFDRLDVVEFHHDANGGVRLPEPAIELQADRQVAIERDEVLPVKDTQRGQSPQPNSKPPRQRRNLARKTRNSTCAAKRDLLLARQRVVGSATEDHLRVADGDDLDLARLGGVRDDAEIDFIVVRLEKLRFRTTSPKSLSVSRFIGASLD